jgi:hypothetical protein
MEMKRGFELTNSYQSRCGRSVYGVPSIRSLEKGKIEDLINMLGLIGASIDTKSSAVYFSIDGSECTASLKEYLNLKNRGSLGKYVLKGDILRSSLWKKEDERHIEIKLKTYGETHGGTIGGQVLIGGEVTIVQGIAGHVKLNIPPNDLDLGNQYFNEIVEKITEWGETCRIPREKSRLEKEIEGNVKKLKKVKPKVIPYNTPSKEAIKMMEE